MSEKELREMDSLLNSLSDHRFDELSQDDLIRVYDSDEDEWETTLVNQNGTLVRVA